MSLLETYVKEQENTESVESVKQRLSLFLEKLKTHVQTLCVSETFEYTMAKLCFEACQCEQHLKNSMTQIQRFVDNSIKKWRDYTLVYKEMLKVIAMITQPVKIIQSAQSSQALSYVPRMNKLPANTIFNVIQINAPRIALQCENKAIVKGLNPRPLMLLETETGGGGGGDDGEEKNEKKFHYDALFRVQLEQLTKNVILVFEAEKHKKHIYLAHYARLGNLKQLEQHCQRVRDELDALYHLSGGCDDDNETRHLLLVMSEALGKLPDLMRETKKNCKDYVFNTVDRFAECSATYKRMLRELSTRRLEFDEMRHLEELQEVPEPNNALFSGMY